MVVVGARTHNLRNVSLRIPHNQLTVITGVSGSGKSSLAFDTIYAEGQRQYIESLSTYARQFLNQLQRPDVEAIEGLQPTLCIDQRAAVTNPRSTVATVTEVYDYLRLLMARVGTPHCYNCGQPIIQQTHEQIVHSIEALPLGTKLVVLAPIVRGRRGSHLDALAAIQKSGLVRARVDGELYELESIPELSPRKNHSIEAIVDKVVVRPDNHQRLVDSVALAIELAGGLVAISYMTPDDAASRDRNVWQERLLSTLYACSNCGSSFEEIEPRTFSFNSPYGACPTCSGTGKANESGLQEPCPACGGARLRREALSVLVGGKSIADLCSLSILDSLGWLEQLEFQPDQLPIARPILAEMLHRLRFLAKVGVGYLSLARSADSLSGGELQRVRLATCIGTGLVGACYILDEPSIGLHQRDNDRLIDSLRDLQQQGNTVIVVEHDEAMMQAADCLIDMGPGAGQRGGQIVAMGTPEFVCNSPTSATAAYLRGDRHVGRSRQTRAITKSNHIRLAGATLHNLQKVTVDIPLGKLLGITGVSGSGKSSLIGRTLVPAIRAELKKVNRQSHPHEDVSSEPQYSPGPYTKLSGVEQIDKLIELTQTPIGRTPRSTPATYCGVFDLIRKVWAGTRDAKSRGYTASRFSFNSGDGRCSICQGQGQERIEMNYLPDLYVTCSMCNGERYNRQTLQVRYRDKSIAQVLKMCIDEAVEFFANFEKIRQLLSSLQQVGLGYVELGQSSNTLSGGEAQRIKLATELSKPETGKTIYFLDEPTTGLHFEDVDRLISVLSGLVDRGNTVIVIEHNLDVIRCCDWLIDLGPEGGDGGGRIVAQGSPEHVATIPESLTGRYLANRF